MSDSMGQLDKIHVIKNKLIESLGVKTEEYMKLMNNWFKLKFSREDLKREIKNVLSPYQEHLHDQLLLLLLRKCAKEPPAARRVRIQQHFEGVDPTCYVLTEREEVANEPPPCMVHERLLPDQSATLARLMYGAWELSLQGASPHTAEFLMIATQHFLKNIITAVVIRRKGFKCGQNGFIHGIGTPLPNPWLKCVSMHKTEPFHSLKFDGVLNGILKPSERPSRESLEKEALFRMAVSEANSEQLEPISLWDLMVTLNLYPSLVASHFVRVTNTERIYARLRHPVIEY